MAFENILVEHKGRIQYITINRESKLNALNKAAERRVQCSSALHHSSRRHPFVEYHFRSVAGQLIKSLCQITDATALRERHSFSR